MIAADRVAVVLLAAGSSTRFGADDKLLQPLDGLALGLHPARTLGGFPFYARIAVTRARGPDYRAHGFTTVVNTDPGAGQSASVRLGVAEARKLEPAAVLIALADMPQVSARHIGALLERFDDAHPIVASTAGGRTSPPALFAASLFDTLCGLNGDAGARSLLNRATRVEAAAGELADVDTPTNLLAMRRP